MLKRRILILVTLFASTAWDRGADAQPVRQRMQLPSASVAFPSGKQVVEVPFQLDRRKIVIPLRVNGSEPLSFVLDTGAPIAGLMNSELAAEWDLTIMGKAQLGGAGAGTAQTVDLASGVEFELGGIEITGATMAIGVGAGKLQKSGWDGIIGRSVFANLVVEIDFAREILRLHRPETFVYQGNGTEIPITLVGGSFPYVKAMISIDEGAAVPTSMVIDVGASHALMLMVEEHPDLELPRDTIQSLLGWGNSGPVHGRAGRVKSVQLGDYVLRDVVASFPDAASMATLPKLRPGDPARQGNIGVELLKRFHVVFDYAHTRLILEPSDAFGVPFTFNRTGLIPAPWSAGDTEIEVGSVIASSPAGVAGIEVGDYLIAMNGKSVMEIEVNTVLSLLEQAPGTELSIQLRRGSQMFTKELTLQDLI